MNIMNNEKILYTKDSHGKIRQWHIYSLGNVINITYGLVDGEQILQTEIVDEGKQTRNIDEQVISRINSRVNKQLDRGYCEKIEDAMNGKPTNSLGLAKPMLAHKFADAKKVDFTNAYLQRKYDGHRCLITRSNGELIAYSRNGKVINSIPHILKYLDNLPEGSTLDGELYAHGKSLQSISSWVKKYQEDSYKLHYIVYDIMEDVNYSERHPILNSYSLNWHADEDCQIQAAPSILIENADEAYECMRSYKMAGYEGAILRLDGYKYEDGKRSHGLLKLKQFDDDNFIVVNIVTAREGWAILTCITENGKEFKVSAPGTFEEKHEIVLKSEDYIGRYVRVEYANLTKDGIPFHPVATNFIDE